MKGNNIINITNNNTPLNIKFISNGKKWFNYNKFSILVIQNEIFHIEYSYYK
jgi:hypothetical protein